MELSKVLFVCVENSCRSQMAEGFAKKLGKGILKCWSAGSKPPGKVNETAIMVMKEKDIDLSTSKSKSLTNLPTREWDYVITMGCGDSCPSVPAKQRKDWAVPDPKSFSLPKFREVRDLIENKIKELISRVLKNA